MNIVLTYLAYLLISVGLTVLAGQVLSRSGRLVLLDALGGSDSAAKGIINLLVVAFYLISLGFVALTMQSPGGSVTARQATQLLAAKTGEALLVLGALYLASIVILARLRRRLKMQAEPGTAVPPPRPAAPESAAAPAPAAAAEPARPDRFTPQRALWRPAPRNAAQ